MAGNTGLYERIYRIVRQIPPGKVATYGQIAGIVGFCIARQVGYALAALPHGSDVPWQRVINSRGEISLNPNGAGAFQLEILRQEGVLFDEGGRTALDRFGWQGFSG